MDVLKLVDIVKKYKGGEDIDRWFKRFETSVGVATTAADDAAKLKQQAKIIPVFLEGPAFSTWDQLDKTSKENYGTIKAALKRVFGLGKAAAWHKLKSLRLFPGESIDVLTEEAKALFRTITGTDPSEELVSLVILDALSPEIKDKVYMLHGEKMKLADVVSSVKALLATEDVRTTSGMAMTARPETRVGRRDSQWSPRCQGCQRRGHSQANCTVVCFSCGSRGHLRRSCPQLQSSVHRDALQPTPSNGGQQTHSSTQSGNGRAGLAAADSVTPAVRT